MRLILDASPVICLAKAGLLEKVLTLATEVKVPRAVQAEICAGGSPQDPAILWLKTPSGSKAVVDVEAPPALVLTWDLGAGEASVVTAALAAPESVPVLDDLAGRRCALALGLPVIGTLGLLLKANRQGVIPALEPALVALREAGLYVGPRQWAEILKLGGG